MQKRAPRLSGLTGVAMIVFALASVAGPAEARPKRRDARTAFDRGVAAYKKGSFEAAAAALSKSFELEHDVDTLFAWAQSERKLEHCDKALDLYEKLLTFDLAAANKDAVNTMITECRAQLPANDHKVEPSPAEPSAVSPQSASPPPGSPPPVSPQPEPPRVADRAMAPEPPPLNDRQPAARAWYKDPITLTLIGSGVIATGVGVGFLVSASSANSDFSTAPDYSTAQLLADRAKSRQQIGFITTGAGAALLAGGVVWIFLHRDSAEQHAVTGWLAPGGGGLAVAGAF